MSFLINPFAFGGAPSAGVAECATGTLSISSASIVGATGSVTGLAFVPKAVVFFSTGSTSAANGAGPARQQVGLATSSSDRRVAGVLCSRNSNPTNDAMTYRDDCVAILMGGAATAGRLDIQSFNSDGFTYIIDEQFTANLQVSYIAIGGTDVTNAITGSFQEPGSTGDVPVTGLGFQPDCVIFLSTHDTASAPSWVDDSTWAVGAATAAGEQFVMAEAGNDNVATTLQRRYVKTGECIAGFSAAATATDMRASLVSLDSDGFTVNFAERASTRQVFYLAIKGGSYTVGSTSAHITLNGTTAVSGLGYAPTGLIAWANKNAENTADTPVSGHRYWTMGVATGPADRRTHTMGHGDAVSAAASSTFWGSRASAILQFNDFTPITSGLQDVSSFDVDGFTLITDDADGAYFIPYLAIG